MDFWPIRVELDCFQRNKSTAKTTLVFLIRDHRDGPPEQIAAKAKEFMAKMPKC
jgi:hypothetical protein